MRQDLDEKTSPIKITRKELYKKYPSLKNLSANEMIQLVALCFQTNSDGDLIYAIKCYLHSYPELAKNENLNKIYEN